MDAGKCANPMPDDCCAARGSPTLTSHTHTFVHSQMRMVEWIVKWKFTESDLEIRSASWAASGERANAHIRENFTIFKLFHKLKHLMDSWRTEKNRHAKNKLLPFSNVDK